MATVHLVVKFPSALYPFSMDITGKGNGPLANQNRSHLFSRNVPEKEITISYLGNKLTLQQNDLKEDKVVHSSHRNLDPLAGIQNIFELTIPPYCTSSGDLTQPYSIALTPQDFFAQIREGVANHERKVDYGSQEERCQLL